MEIKKVVTTVVLSAASAGSIWLLKNKGGFSGDGAATLAKNSSEVIKTIPKTFEGVTEEEINNLAQATYRGIKARINGDTLTYIYRSASGKTKNYAEVAMKEGGKRVVTLYSNMTANSPRQFVYALEELIESKKNS